MFENAVEKLMYVGLIKVWGGHGGSSGACVAVFPNIIVKLRLLECVVVWVGMEITQVNITVVGEIIGVITYL